MSTISRRDLLLSIPALALAPRLSGQAAKPAITVKGLNYFVLSVSDMKRSIDFYQGLFGMPIQARQRRQRSVADRQGTAVPDADSGRLESAQHRSASRTEGRQL